MGMGNDSRWQHSHCFLPFPFPDPTAKAIGAITALAEADAEWEETRLKARAVLDALGVREVEDTPESATLSADGQ